MKRLFIIIVCATAAMLAQAANNGNETPMRATCITHDAETIYLGFATQGLMSMSRTTGECQWHEGTADKNLWSLAAHGDELWLGTWDHGLYRLCGGELTWVADKTWVGALGFNGDDLWVGYMLLSLDKMSGGSVAETYTVDWGASQFGMANAIAFAPDGTVWVGGQDNSREVVLCKLSGGVYTALDYHDFSVSALVAGPDGTLWVATPENGLIALKDGVRTDYNSENSPLPDDALWDMKQDKDGHLWLLSPEALTMFDGSTFTAFPLQIDSKSALCMDIVGDDIYIGSSDGLYRFSEGKAKEVQLPSPTGIRAQPQKATEAQRFDVDGRRITDTPRKGIYIERIGGTARKVILK